MKMWFTFLTAVCVLGPLTFTSGGASATTGSGCLRPYNIPPGDVLNIRKGPSANSRIVAVFDPYGPGILVLRGTCVPKSVAWGSRWCPVTFIDDVRSVRGYVKARYVRDSECP